MLTSTLPQVDAIELSQVFQCLGNLLCVPLDFRHDLAGFAKMIKEVRSLNHPL